MLKLYNQPHLLDCEALSGSNQLVTYIHEYEDIFDDDNIEEQYFIANILMANRKRKKEIESAQSYFPFAPLSSVLLCLPPWFWIY